MKASLRTGLLLLPALLLPLSSASAPAQIGIGISITTAPPMLPDYSQPPCPDQGYLWEPGYWAWGPYGYYWVPGVWVMPPQPGLFWTPGYWAFENGAYMWNEGYWGPEVGFYGGVDYGFGYPGEGFYGGMWRGNDFRYNVSVWHVGGGFRNTYRAPETWRSPWHSRASFNGGHGGIPARPSPQDQRAMHQPHFQPTPRQVQYRQAIARDPRYQFKTNHGRPPRPAMTRVSAAPAIHRAAPPARRPMPSRPQAGQQQPHRRPQSRPAPGAQPRPLPRRPYRPQNRPMPTPQSRPAPRPQTRPQNRPMPRPQSRPMPRPQPPPQERPAPHPQPHPQG